MTKKQLHKLAVICRLTEIIGGILIFIGIFWVIGIASTSDFEAEIGEILHPFSWYLLESIRGMLIAAVGSLLSASPKKVYRFVRDTNKTYLVGKQVRNQRGF